MDRFEKVKMTEKLIADAIDYVRDRKDDLLESAGESIIQEMKDEVHEALSCLNTLASYLSDNMEDIVPSYEYDNFVEEVIGDEVETVIDAVVTILNDAKPHEIV